MTIELIIEGKKLEPRLWKPFEWFIPEELKGKQTELTFRVATSIAPIFADYPAHFAGKIPEWACQNWTNKPTFFGSRN